MILHAKDPHILSLLATSPSSIFAWIAAKTDEAKMAILNDLRTQQITRESKSRRYISKLEAVYFSYLIQFFTQLETLHVNRDKPEFQKQLQEICTVENVQSSCIYAIDLKSKHWAPIYRNAITMLANQTLGKKVDWTSFINQYCSAFEEHFVEYWGLFYSKVTDDVNGLEIAEANKIIGVEYEKLHFSSYGSHDAIISILSHILFKASQPEIEKEAAKQSEISSMTFFAKNPIKSYQQASQHVKEKNHQEALKYCEVAMEAFRANPGEMSNEMGKCYSLQASCYRDLGLFAESLVACESAINIYHSLTATTELAAVLVKYKGCLLKSEFGIDKLYPSAMILFKEQKNYEAAKSIMLHLLENIPDLTPVQKGNCYSTLASCYRELGVKDKAIEACENAITSFKTAKVETAKRTALIEPVLKKLEGLKANPVSQVKSGVR